MAFEPFFSWILDAYCDCSVHLEDIWLSLLEVRGVMTYWTFFPSMILDFETYSSQDMINNSKRENWLGGQLSVMIQQSLDEITQLATMSVIYLCATKANNRQILGTCKTQAFCRVKRRSLSSLSFSSTSGSDATKCMQVLLYPCFENTVRVVNEARILPFACFSHMKPSTNFQCIDRVQGSRQGPCWK